MTAHASQYDSSHPSNPNPENQHGFVYDSSESAPPEAEYVPEREFVLMPLFRRIGQLLGIRREPEPEYIYEPATQLAEQPFVSRTEHVEAQPLQEARISSSNFQNAVEPAEPQSQTPHIQIEPPQTQSASFEPLPEPLSGSQRFESESITPEPEQIAAPIHFESEPLTEVIEPEPTEWTPIAESAQEQQSELVIAPVAEVAPEQVVASEALPLAPAQSRLTQEEARDLVAQIRDAASRITAAVSQAATWVHTKEEEILRRTEMPLEPKEKTIEVERYNSGSHPPLPVVATQSALSEENEAPVIQRERARRENERMRNSAAKWELNAPVIAKTGKGPRLVKQADAVPFWKRIDWEKQFAPKRIAVYGGCAMAILMVLGISLARRPAASNLPVQTTHSLQPGGVTLTTHPVSSTPSRPAVAQKKTTLPSHKVVSRSSRAEDGPEVVTHYYNGKPKPSPVHQSTVAGVRHYSDM
ncbi:MAG: hypothetical protein JOZ10_05375 [Acidobacteria bacterium]|nr:hypothetical protein [Acidobacteriota bacterium]